MAWHIDASSDTDHSKPYAHIKKHKAKSGCKWSESGITKNLIKFFQISNFL